MDTRLDTTTAENPYDSPPDTTGETRALQKKPVGKLIAAVGSALLAVLASVDAAVTHKVILPSHGARTVRPSHTILGGVRSLSEEGDFRSVPEDSVADTAMKDLNAEVRQLPRDFQKILTNGAGQ